MKIFLNKPFFLNDFLLLIILYSTSMSAKPILIDSSSLKSSSIEWQKPIKLNAQKNASLSGIPLTWDTYNSDYKYELYVIRPNLNYNSTEYILLDSNITSNSYIDTLAPPGWQKYKLVIKNPRSSDTKEAEALGYRKVTNSEFFKQFRQMIMKAQSKVKRIHESELKALGNEGVNGDSSGILEYSAHISDKGAIVTFGYNNYSDFYLTLNGKRYSVISDILTESGTIKGKITTSGIYKGNVVYNITLDKGKPNGGYYIVSQDEGVVDTVSYNRVDTKILDNPYYHK